MSSLWKSASLYRCNSGSRWAKIPYIQRPCLERPIANLDTLHAAKTNPERISCYTKLPIVVKGFFKDLVSAGTARAIHSKQ